MKKPNKIRELCTDDADTVANRMAKGMTREKAYKVAKNIASTLNGMGVEDANPQFSDPNHVKKQARFWKQVQDILAKDPKQTNKALYTR